MIAVEEFEVGGAATARVFVDVAAEAQWRVIPESRARLGDP
jgi:hypothetical protein